MNNLLTVKFLVPALATLLVGGGAVWVAQNDPEVPPVIPENKTTNTKVTPVPKPSSDQNGSTATNKGSGSTTTGTSQPATTAPLKVPFGDFVSNHHPSLSGSPAPSEETSVCNTTPGASCYIQFSQGATTTKLPAKTADSSGSAYWDWDVKTAKLTAGDWTITAVASLNGKTKSTKDPLPLTVSQ